jgi:hypothetical protein
MTLILLVTQWLIDIFGAPIDCIDWCRSSGQWSVTVIVVFVQNAIETPWT